MYLCLAGGSCPPFLPPGSMALVWGRGEAGITLPPSAPFCSHLKDPEEQTPGPQPVLSPYRVSMKKAAPKARYPRLSVLLWSNVLPHLPVFPQLTLESSSAVLAPQPGFILGGPVGKPRP